MTVLNSSLFLANWNWKQLVEYPVLDQKKFLALKVYLNFDPHSIIDEAASVRNSLLETVFYFGFLSFFFFFIAVFVVVQRKNRKLKFQN